MTFQAPTMEQLQEQITQLMEHISSMQQPAPVSNGTALAIQRDLGKAFQKPPEFDGKDRKACASFVSYLNLYIGGNRILFADERSKVMLAASYLRGRAFTWFEPYLLSPDSPIFADFTTFTDELTRNLGDPDRNRTLTKDLQNLRQTGAASDYSSRFYQISSYLSWNDEALLHWPEIRSQRRPG